MTFRQQLHILLAGCFVAYAGRTRRKIIILSAIPAVRPPEKEGCLLSWSFIRKYDSDHREFPLFFSELSMCFVVKPASINTPEND